MILPCGEGAQLHRPTALIEQLRIAHRLDRRQPVAAGRQGREVHARWPLAPGIRSRECRAGRGQAAQQHPGTSHTHVRAHRMMNAARFWLPAERAENFM